MVRKKPTEPSEIQAKCVHHWIIDTPSGGKYSKGKCKKCRLVKVDFLNSEQEMDFSEGYSINGYSKKRKPKVEA